MRESNEALEEISRANSVHEAYSEALQAMSDSHITVMKFQRQPTEELNNQFESDVMRAAAALSYVQDHGSEEDRALIQRLYLTYAPRLPEVSGLLEQALAEGSTGSEDFPPGTLIEEIRNLLEEPAQARSAEASLLLSQHQDAQRRQTAIVVGGLFLGLPLLAGLLILVRVYERRETVANINMERLELAALTDSLTGLGNHRAYQEELHREVEESLESQQSLSLALIDVDEFKEVNDTAGHARGDQILIQMGRLLKEACGNEDRRFRIGGDEFAVIMPAADQTVAREAMERFRSLASLTGATVSIGVAQLDVGDDLEILREKADATLYTAKRRGRNTVSTFSGDNAEQMLVTQSKIKALRDLIRDDHIDVAFQPIRTSNQGTIMGYEALARIPAQISLSGPQDAFDIAERIGRAHDLDFLCIRESLGRAKGLASGELLFLNLSPRTLDHAGFSAAALAEMAVDAGLQPGQVCLEITERSTAPIAIVEQGVTELRSLGFKIALDDVGAGHAGLEMMGRLRVDFVKIDRSVMVGAMEPGPGRGVLLAIIVFASEAGATVIAEGIETQEMLDVIRETNAGPFAVQGVQGYIFGQPDADLTSFATLPLTA